MPSPPDWTLALQKQLNSFVREAWLDYQSSPQFRKAWCIGEAKQGEIRARIEQDIQNMPPDRVEFLEDLCFELSWQFCVLILPGFMSQTRSDPAEAVLDGLATAMGSIPERSASRTESKRRLTGIIDQLTQTLDELAREGRETDLLAYYASDKLATLLTASPLREGFLRPLLIMIAILLAVFERFKSNHFDHQIRTFMGQVSKLTDLSAADLTSFVGDVAAQVRTVSFEGEALKRSEEVLRMMRAGIPARGINDRKSDAAPAGTPRPEAASRELPSVPATELDSEFDKAISELTGMIGLSEVKKEVTSLANYIRVQQLRAANNLKQPPISLHLVFSGSPGTGKTTVARLVAKLYKALGILSSGHLVETDRSGLVVGYVGQTATKTKEVVDSAMDGVLFIDEAYSLVKDAPWDFGPEAIETLLKLMEDHRERLVVIVAGYTEPMAAFIASNPGLQSRFTRRIEFQDYTAQEMLQIFERIAYVHNFELAPGAVGTLLEYFESVAGDDGFGNGRGVRNVFEASTMRHANRVAAMAQPTYLDLTTLTEPDVCTTKPGAREVGPMDDLSAGYNEDGFNDRSPQSESAFEMGDRVFHQKFGYGIVSEIDGIKLTIEFEKDGPRRVVDSFVEKV
ncbi:MAG: AAA family ATPase [Bradyrhizobium sp.]|uniref:AAA family ATPase n=1 Tax=Bradyrhizobium sp. TaxID=376 RepID=UPI0011FBD49B|nr:AAA family ATPase [Bradyrhizobium sp.]THD57113.1 MAG: AAA family ATPase [Bradyrhizobium sp.]